MENMINEDNLLDTSVNKKEIYTGNDGNIALNNKNIPFIDNDNDGSNYSSDEEEEEEGEGQYASDSDIKEITPETSIHNITDNQIPGEWRCDMYNFFYEKGKSRGTENQVRNRIIELFMWHDTNDIITANDIPFSSNSNKSFRAKIKSHVNKFFNNMEATNYNNVKNRAMFMELFTRLLLDLPKNKFEHLVDFSQKSNYLYSFFDQRILSHFLKMDTCNRSRGTLYIKAMLYDMHRSQPEDFEALLSVMKNKDFLMAFKHFYLIAAFTI